MPNTEKQMTACQMLINYMEESYHLTEESRLEFKQALATERKQLIDFGAGCIDKSKKSDLFETKNIAKQNYFNTFKTQ
jgi:Uri superfamily endonuclease